MILKTHSLLLTLFVVITILVNILSNTLPFNGQTTAVVSNKYFTFFTPTGFTFAIWGVIYIGWIAFAAYSWMKMPQRDADRLHKAIPWFILNSIGNMTWLFLWHYELLGPSVLVMLVILLSLLRVYSLLGIGVQTVDSRTKWLMHVPISTYLGWISVATIANISSALTQSQWNGFGIPGQIWSMIMLIAAGVLGALMLKRRSDFAFALVVVWAAIGIAINFSNKAQEVTVTALGVALVLVVWILTKAFARKYPQ